MPDQHQARIHKALQTLEQFEQALARLDEVLHLTIDQQSILRDATIQRFEFVIELCWKCLKRCLLVEGIEVFTPKETLKNAFQSHWIDNEALWLAMLDDRNLTSHIYQESQAIAIYQRIPQYYPELSKLLAFLKNHLQTAE